MSYDAPTAAMAAALYAVKPQEDHFKLSVPGAIQVDDDGRTKFMPVENGKHRYLILNQEKKQQVLAAYVLMASAQPVPPPGRRRSPAAQQQQPAPVLPNKPPQPGKPEKPDSPR